MINKISTSITLIQKAEGWYQQLTQRERLIIRVAFLCMVFLLLWFVMDSTLQYKKNIDARARSSSELIPHVAQLAQRIHGLEARKNELTTLYLNSTLSYEELTTYLDTLIKSKIGNDTYSLNKSQDTENIGEDFILQKFTIKINDAKLDNITSLLHAFETGTPRMFVQRTDIVKNRTKGNLSLTLELTSVQSSNRQ